MSPAQQLEARAQLNLTQSEKDYDDLNIPSSYHTGDTKVISSERTAIRIDLFNNHESDRSWARENQQMIVVDSYRPIKYPEPERTSEVFV